jgi:hypothetical protein
MITFSSVATKTGDSVVFSWLYADEGRSHKIALCKGNATRTWNVEMLPMIEIPTMRRFLPVMLIL